MEEVAWASLKGVVGECLADGEWAAAGTGGVVEVGN